MCLNDIFLVDFRNVLKIERGESVMITPYASFQNLIYQGRSQDFEKGEANVTEGGAEGTYN